MSPDDAVAVAVSAAEARVRAGRFAAGLRTLGVAPGDRVAVALPSSWQVVALVWACLSIDAIPVPLDPRLTDRERDVILDQVDPAVVVDDPSPVTAWEDLEPLPVTAVPRCRPMHATSGTTGTPKGVWSGWWTPPDAEAALAEERELWGFGPGDVTLVVSPTHHSAPLRFALHTWLAGGTVVVLPAFGPRAFWDAVGTHRPTTMFCVPTHLQRLQQAGPPPATVDPRCFRLVAHAGAPCPEHVRRAAHEVFGIDTVWEFYGSTEGQFTACSGTEWARHGAGLGRARPGRRLFTDDEDVLWCTVPPWGRFTYWGDLERTAEAWRETADGPAFTVGDLGHVDEDGWVHLWSRRTDLIITGGVNVYPAEVEQVLGRVPGVEDVAVHAVADATWGQRVCATVVGAVAPAALEAQARAHLAPPKRPKEYRFVEALPRTATGKIRRHELLDPS